jgi:hypothetical protein
MVSRDCGHASGLAKRCPTPIEGTHARTHLTTAGKELRAAGPLAVGALSPVRDNRGRDSLIYSAIYLQDPPAYVSRRGKAGFAMQ